jgi:hypothetical protein
MCPGDQLPDPSTTNEQVGSLQLVILPSDRSIQFPHSQVVPESALMRRQGEDQDGDSHPDPSRNWREILNRYTISSTSN